MISGGTIFRQLGGARIRVDRAIAVDQNLIRQQHEEHRGHQAVARCGLDQLQGWADGIGGGVRIAWAMPTFLVVE